MVERERGAAMLDRVAAEAGAALGGGAAARVRAALEPVVAWRRTRVPDDHDPRYLHTGRCIRILLSDAQCTSIDALCAAAYLDSVDPHLSPEPDALGAGARSVLDQAPVGGDAADLLERIVTAPPEAALIALVDRLDHARHLHLRDDLDRRSFHEEVRTVWVPAARRIAPPVARRFEHWADAFERRLLLGR